MSNYYNDHDKNACAWIRELIAQKLIPRGDVDSRSILEISPDELKGYTQCHFFAGVAGWSLALRLAGWPDDEEVWSGSCPCQPLSCAGLGKGHADERHLWPAFYSLISKRRPAIVLGEQVASADGREWFSGVRADLEGTGYACGGADLPAAGVGSPNIRQRLFWVSDSGNRGQPGHERDGDQPGRIGAQPIGSASESGEPLRMANADGGNASTERQQRGGQQRLFTEGDGTCGMGDTESGGCGISGHETQPGNGGHLIRPSWSGSQIIACRDGKSRRIPSPVEPGFLRLADGIPEGLDIGWILGAFPLCQRIKGRTALLRGFGNAINPVAAAEFIKAFMETKSQ